MSQVCGAGSFIGDGFEKGCDEVDLRIETGFCVAGLGKSSVYVEGVGLPDHTAIDVRPVHGKCNQDLRKGLTEPGAHEVPALDCAGGDPLCETEQALELPAEEGVQSEALPLPQKLRGAARKARE